MFRRVFWFGAGAAAGIWATTKVNRKLRALTPESLAVTAADRIRTFAQDVRAQTAARESELNDALGLAAAREAPETGLPAPRPEIAYNRHRKDEH